MERSYLIKMLAVLLLCFSQYSNAENENAPNSDHQRYTAIIEGVIDVADQGYRSINYLVTWKGNQIVVPAPNLYVRKKKGDELKFLVMWHELKTESGSIKNLGFTALE